MSTRLAFGDPVLMASKRRIPLIELRPEPRGFNPSVIWDSVVSAYYSDSCSTCLGLFGECKVASQMPTNSSLGIVRVAASTYHQ